MMSEQTEKREPTSKKWETELKLFDNRKNRIKSEILGKLEIMADDEDNPDADFWEALDDELEWGGVYRLSIQEITEQPLPDTLHSSLRRLVFDGSSEKYCLSEILEWLSGRASASEDLGHDDEAARIKKMATCLREIKLLVENEQPSLNPKT